MGAKRWGGARRSAGSTPSDYGPSGRIDAEVYQRLLGEELRKARRRRGLTRPELNGLMGNPVSVQTLATYEHGTRQCSVVRLVEVCRALGEPPQEVLARVNDRMMVDEVIRVDLARIAQSSAPELQPLRRWARVYLRSGKRATVRLGAPAIDQLAVVCGTGRDDVVELLRAATAVCRTSGSAAPDK